jgi:hypothetical protein
MKAVAVGAVALVLGLSACGSGNPATPGGPATTAVLAGGSTGTDAQACSDIRQTITDVSRKGVDQLRDSPTSNPTTMAQTYRDGAATIRRQAESSGGDVRQAANKVADEFEKLADGVAGLADGSKAPQMPDINALTAAGQELQQACT